MAYVDDYTEFAVGTAKQVVEEETEKLLDEMLEDVRALIDTWAERLLSRIDDRMEALGIEQHLAVKISWDPVNMPEFEFHGSTNAGVDNG